MNIPEILWNQKLENGQTLAEFVGGSSPSRLPLADLVSFTEIWSNRLAAAQSCKRKDLEVRANSILRFLSMNRQGVCLLMWPKHRLSVLFAEHPEAFVLIDETSS
jgi:hypothetical protein